MLIGSSKDKVRSRARRSPSKQWSPIPTTSFQAQNEDGTDSAMRIRFRSKGNDFDQSAPGSLVIASGHVSKKMETKSESRNRGTMINVWHCDCASAYLSS